MSREKTVIFVLCLVLIFSWFRYGLIYGGGDIGLPLYDPSLSAEISKFTWWDAQGTGFSYPAISPSYPFYLALSIFQKIGFTPFLIQILFFFSMLILSGFGIFYLGKILTKDSKISFLASIFYLINPYTMMNIWHRFAHTTMVMMAFIPWTLVILYLGAKRRRFIFALILSAVSLFGAYSIGTPAFLATWWFLVLTFWIYLFWVDKGKNKLKFYLTFLICLVLFWLGFHLWWLVPFLKTASQALFLSATSTGNIENLRGVSRYASLPYVLRGISSFYLTQQVDWGKIYLNPLFKILSWLGVGAILISFFNKRKPKYFFFFGFLFLITIFVSKGSEIPLGNLIVFAFTLFPSLGVFRNPFEKFGVLLPLASSFLFSYGAIFLWNKAKASRKKNFLKPAIIVLLVSFFVVYHWPMWMGKVFGSLDHPALIDVPDDYKLADQWFEKNKDAELRILHLPLALGDGITYAWEHGYNGLEPSQLFFPGSSISHFLGYGLIDGRFQEIAESVRNKDEDLFRYFILRFGINYIVFHKDADFKTYRTDSLENIESFLENLDFVNKQAEFGKLVIYSAKKDIQHTSKIYLHQAPTLITGDLLYLDSELFAGEATVPTVYGQGDFISKARTVKEITLPDHIIDYPVITVSKENAIKEMPYARFLPESFFYPLIRIKERLSLLGKAEEEKFFARLNYTSKRLVEVNGLLESGKHDVARKTLEDYQKSIAVLFPEIEKRVKTLSANDIEEIQFYQVVLFRQREAFGHHILPKAKGDLESQVKAVLNFIDRKISEVGLIRLHPLDIDLPSTTFRFDVERDDNYFLFLKKDSWEDVLPASRTPLIFVDGKEIAVNLRVEERFLRLGPFRLTKGEREISSKIESENLMRKVLINEIKNENLVTNISENADSFKIASILEENFVEYELKDVKSDSFYQISFEYWVERGLPPKLSVIQDVDPTREGKILPALEKLIPGDGYEFYWKPLFVNLKPSSFTHKMKVRISLEPWNNCERIHLREKEKCKDPEFARPYNRESNVEVRNLAIHQVPTGGAFLTEISTSQKKDNDPLRVGYLRLNPTKYEVNLEGKTSGLLVFKETFYDGWVIKDAFGDKIPATHVLVDGYANGWILEDVTGKVYIEFESQAKKKDGLLLCLAFILLGSVVAIRAKKYERLP